MREKINAYYKLTKPGVLYGNVLTALAGFLFASQGHVNTVLFLTLSAGMTLVIASACVLNNYLDQDIDSKMARTKPRPLISGDVSGKGAIIYSILLGLIGLLLLVFFTNWLVVVIGVIGFFDYVVLYGILSKRLSIHGTLVGSVSGAAPILAGYVAVTNSIDTGALIVFIILFLWQMPEFYSIAIYRRKEYAAAGIPVISVVKGSWNTAIQIFIYTVLFVLATLLLAVMSHASRTYFIIMGTLGIYWIWLGYKGLRAKASDAWARKMFHFSLIVLVVFCFVLSVDSFLP
jgi:protoheme IX farnesyltransferase